MNSQKLSFAPNSLLLNGLAPNARKQYRRWLEALPNSRHSDIIQKEQPSTYQQNGGSVVQNYIARNFTSSLRFQIPRYAIYTLHRRKTDDKVMTASLLCTVSKPTINHDGIAALHRRKTDDKVMVHVQRHSAARVSFLRRVVNTLAKGCI